ncbi:MULTISPECIES: amidohydrolase family protein [Tsukamurella]|uniref:6-methylsalicylate decarboxylase n=2 Tax=Tsukamurella TaxID=2060 RepID=A0A5C5S0L2_9ACTN|nr:MULTISPECIES: amidohydrolase family protein [Tsukamurella]NMD54261.1 amidohydrolase family protein [Tsukamurella columbiensis]TWS28220.1 amidohydrolase family protein [Tsukamurella conjunctivitidis]
MTDRDRIDVHTHLVPPFWGDALADHGGDPSGWALPRWSEDAHLSFMDDNDIATSVVSLTAPSVVGWRGSERRDMARRVNEYAADLVRRRPDRFGAFATVPLPDVDDAVAEAEYALTELAADGVVLLSNYDGVYLGDPAYTPLWETLDRHRAVVFIHPAHAQLPLLPDMPGPLVDYPFDTTRNAVHMVLHGITDRFPNIRIILSHAGGFVPYAALRFCELQAALDPAGRSSDELLAAFRTFYWDTALSSGRYAFAALREFADPSRILYGSDFPYAPPAVGTRFTRILDEESDLDPDAAAAIDRGNALRIVDRLA